MGALFCSGIGVFILEDDTLLSTCAFAFETLGLSVGLLDASSLFCSVTSFVDYLRSTGTSAVGDVADVSGFEVNLITMLERGRQLYLGERLPRPTTVWIDRHSS